MNKNIMRAAGFSTEVDAIEEGRCPFCKKLIESVPFKDDISRKEYEISGLCQECQDDIWAPLAEDMKMVASVPTVADVLKHKRKTS